MAEARLVLTDRLIDAALGRPEKPNPKALRQPNGKTPHHQKPKAEPRKPDRRRQPIE
jgi:hypothetical protein